MVSVQDVISAIKDEHKHTLKCVRKRAKECLKSCTTLVMAGLIKPEDISSYSLRCGHTLIIERTELPKFHQFGKPEISKETYGDSMTQVMVCLQYPKLPQVRVKYVADVEPGAPCRVVRVDSSYTTVVCDR